MPGQVALFDPEPPVERFDLSDADVVLHRHVWHDEDADRLMRAVHETTPWVLRHVTIAGRQVPIPRLSAWFGDPGADYTYSGIHHVPVEWTAPMTEVRHVVERLVGVTFNSCLANLYRDGADSVAWHADDEPELGREPVIASVSLGEPRTFAMRRHDSVDSTVRLCLPHGSVLVMAGTTQTYWRHCVPKTRRVLGPRINLTFRSIAHTFRP